jgi:hypothetical protein
MVALPEKRKRNPDLQHHETPGEARGGTEKGLCPEISKACPVPEENTGVMGSESEVRTRESVSYQEVLGYHIAMLIPH